MKHVFMISVLMLGTFVASCSPVKIQKAEIECASITGADEILRPDAPPITILGEFHGTQEMPRFAGDLVCQSLKAGFKTVLALEYHDEEMQRIQSLLKATDSDAARKEFLSGEIWTDSYSDGRTSKAMLTLIERIGEYQVAGFDVAIRTFKPDVGEYEELVPDNPTQGYELKMSKKILQVSKHGQKTIVLVGNMHAKRGKASWPGRAEYEFAASHIHETDAMTFDARYLSGTSWNCRPIAGIEKVSCGEFKTGGYETRDGYIVPEFSQGIETEPSSKSYNGTFFIGTISASPPAGVIEK